jgi:hypothetical protein
MKTVLLAAGAAALALSAGQALANTHSKHHKGATASAAAGPAQPIPYAQLDSYLKASSSQRAKKDWWSGQPALASSGAAATSGANASATTTPSPSDTSVNPVSPAPSSSTPPPSSDTTPK